MKWNCGPSLMDRILAAEEAKQLWHEWFAWHPVRIADDDCRWLEAVERKGTVIGDMDGGHWFWEYRGKE